MPMNGAPAWVSRSALLTGPRMAFSLPAVPVHGLVLHPNNSNYVYVGTEIGLFVSPNQGRDWSYANTGPVNTRVSDVKFVLSTAGVAAGAPPVPTLYVATYGRGVWKKAIPAAAAQ